MIYQFSCHCDSRYVGRTSQRLQDRIKQHVPKSICPCSSSQKCLLPARRCKSSTQTNTQSLASDSVVGLHLLQNPTCAQHYDDSRFSILAQGCSPFHLSALEAIFIKTNPALCRQKRIQVQLKDCTLMALSHWSFSSQSQLSFFLYAHFPALSVLTILLDKCQMKNFEDVNILIKAILKFCITNQLFNLKTAFTSVGAIISK